MIGIISLLFSAKMSANFPFAGVLTRVLRITPERRRLWLDSSGDTQILSGTIQCSGYSKILPGILYNARVIERYLQVLYTMLRLFKDILRYFIQCSGYTNILSGSLNIAPVIQRYCQVLYTMLRGHTYIVLYFTQCSGYSKILSGTLIFSRQNVLLGNCTQCTLYNAQGTQRYFK